MSIIETIKQYFSFYSVRRKYGEFNVAADRYLPIAEFKEKYLALKKYPEGISLVLGGQSLDNLHDDIERFVFLAVEFSDYFKLSDRHKTLNTTPIANALLKNKFTYANLTAAAEMLSTDVLKNHKTTVPILEADVTNLMIKALEQNHYWMFLILYTKYKTTSSFSGLESFSNLSENLKNYINSAEQLPWFIKLIPPKTNKSIKNNMGEGGSGLLDLHIAVLHEHKDSISILLESEHADTLLASLDKNNKSALEIAIENKYQTISNDLLRKMKKETKGHKEVIKSAILSAYKNKNNAWALSAAKQFELLEEPLGNDGLTLVDLLAKQGELNNGNISLENISPEQHKSALLISAQMGKLDVVKYLLNKNIEIDLEDYADESGRKRNNIFQNCYDLIKKEFRTRKGKPDTIAMPVKVYEPDKFKLQLVNFDVDVFGEGPLHRAVRSGQTMQIADCAAYKDSFFHENKKGHSAFDLALTLNKQDIFNTLVNLCDKDSAPKTRRIGHINAEHLLDFIKCYFSSYPAQRNNKNINFFWNYFGKPACESAIGEDKLKIAYFFKRLYIKVADEEAVNSTLPNEGLSDKVMLAKKIIKFSKMRNENVMIALNTKKHGFGWGESSLHAKLEELISLAARKIPCTPHDVQDNIHRLIAALGDDHLYKKMTGLIKELNNMSSERSHEYNVESQINQVFNKLRV